MNKLKNQPSFFSAFKASIASVALLACMLGTQFIGVVHEMKHDLYLKISPTSVSLDEVQDTYGHDNGSKPCKLFDGLALSAFLAYFLVAFTAFNHLREKLHLLKPQPRLFAFFRYYASQAPPQSPHP